MHKLIPGLYNRYNKTLRPLVSEIEGRNEYFEEPLLLDITQMFDAMALAECGEFSDEDRDIMLALASSSMDLSISHSYQYLIKSLDEKVRGFENRCKASDRNILDGGKFIGKYVTLRKSVRTTVRIARKKDDATALPDYRKAYEDYSKIEKMVDRELPVQIMHNTRKNSIIWTVIGWVVSIAVSIACGKFAAMYSSNIINWIITWKAE